MNLHILTAGPDGTVEAQAQGADAEFSPNFGQRGDGRGPFPAPAQIESWGTERRFQAST